MQATEVKAKETTNQESFAEQLERMFEQARGYFFPGDVIKDAWMRDSGIKQEGIQLEYLEVQKLYRELNCYCGHCEHFNVEVYPEGRFRIHHHNKNDIKTGRFR